MTSVFGIKLWGCFAGHAYSPAGELRDPASFAFAQSGLATGPHPRLTTFLASEKFVLSAFDRKNRWHATISALEDFVATPHRLAAALADLVLPVVSL